MTCSSCGLFTAAKPRCSTSTCSAHATVCIQHRTLRNHSTPLPSFGPLHPSPSCKGSGGSTMPSPHRSTVMVVVFRRRVPAGPHLPTLSPRWLVFSSQRPSRDGTSSMLNPRRRQLYTLIHTQLPLQGWHGSVWRTDLSRCSVVYDLYAHFISCMVWSCRCGGLRVWA